MMIFQGTILLAHPDGPPDYRKAPPAGFNS